MSVITILSRLMGEAGESYYAQVAETHRLMNERIASDAKSPLRGLMARAISKSLESEATLLAAKTALEAAFRAVCEEETHEAK